MKPSYSRVLGWVMLVLGTLSPPLTGGPVRAGAAPHPARPSTAATPSRSARRETAGADVARRGLAEASGVAVFSPANVRALLEPRVRAVVAEQLAVHPGELARAVSLPDDLAADSLDMLELVVALESAFDIVLPPPAIAKMRSYGDVLDAVLSARLDARWDDLATQGIEVRLRSRISREGTSGGLTRVERLTPYAIETIEDDALRVGRGARLDVGVCAGHQALERQALTYVRDRLAWLEERGIRVAVRRV